MLQLFERRSKIFIDFVTETEFFKNEKSINVFWAFEFELKTGILQLVKLNYLD